MPTYQIEHTGQIITPGAIRAFWIILVGLGLGLLALVVPLVILAGVLATLLFALLVLHNPYWGLLAYLTVFLIRPQEVWTSFGGQLPIEKTLAIAVLVATIVSPKIRRQNKIIFSNTSVAMLVFTGVIFVTVPIAVWRGGALDYAMEFAKIAIVFFLITQLCDTPRRVRTFVWVYLLCHLWVAGSAVYSYYTDPAYVRMGIQRAQAYALTMGDPNSVAASLNFALPFALLFFKSYRNVIARVLLAVLVAVSVYAIIFTGSRSGMITLIILSILLALRTRHKFPALLLTAGILFSVWAVMPEMYQKRFLTIFKEEEDQAGAKESALGRWRGLRLGFKMFVDRPILGVGVGNFAPAWYWLYTIDGKRDWSQPHNMMAQLISELGTVGLVTFAAFLYFAVRQVGRLKAVLRRFSRPPPELKGFWGIASAVQVGYVLLLISGLFGHNLYRYNWYHYAALVVAMGAVVSRHATETAPNENT